MKHRILFTVLMSGMLSFFMTLWITYINIGVGSGFVSKWLFAFLLAWPAAGIISFVVSPIAQRITAAILGPVNSH
ncbi:DUF2798 domain-containing protein [Sessilibacter corallicola]|uniref:DUF2798 domain-containing protein n=2 Tax=Sessilibacter corallicola TaxID=2904075 RepID=A0ABQ0AEP4_9GAMM